MFAAQALSKNESVLRADCQDERETETQSREGDNELGGHLPTLTAAVRPNENLTSAQAFFFLPFATLLKRNVVNGPRAMCVG